MIVLLVTYSDCDYCLCLMCMSYYTGGGRRLGYIYIFIKLYLCVHVCPRKMNIYNSNILVRLVCTYIVQPCATCSCSRQLKTT
jgi:hypothetical protein